MSSKQCLVCGDTNNTLWATATDGEYFTTTDTYSYYQCHQCHNLFIHPCPKDKLSVIYPSNYYSFSQQKENFVLKIKKKLDNQLFLKILEKLSGKSLNILDVGGGSGWLLDQIKALDTRVSLTQIVDIDPDAKQVAESMGHVFSNTPIEDFQSAQKFDLVLMLNLIEHVHSPEKVLKNIKTLLTADGKVLIKTPNYDSLDARIFRHKNWAGYHCPRHWALFTKETLIDLCQKSGYTIDDFSYTQGAPFWTGSVLYMLYKYKLIRLSKDRPVHTHPLFGPLNALFAGVDFCRQPFSKPSQMFVTLSLKKA